GGDRVGRARPCAAGCLRRGARAASPHRGGGAPPGDGRGGSGGRRPGGRRGVRAVIYRLYGGLVAILALAYLPVFLVRKVWRAGARVALAERLGWVPLRPDRERLWIHAVSVGEVAAAVPLVRALRARWPELELVVSTVTGTGASVARTRLPEAALVFTC